MASQSQSQSQSQALDPDRLQELLRPIRELSAVWDIHLTNFLDDYLTRVSEIDLSEDFNPDTLNFSQAGLLLQGTTNIYAKKVKHLYDLVTSSTAIPDTDESAQKNKKRQRKTIDYVKDEKLIPIEMPETVDSTILDTEEPRLEITTMPKIPFCLLHSLDSKTQSGQANFRINNVPNQENGVIILDGSQQFSTLTVADEDQFSGSELEPDLPEGPPPVPSGNESDAGDIPPPPNDDSDIGAPPPDNTDESEFIPQQDAANEADERIPAQAAAAHPKKRERRKKEKKDAILLDPDALVKTVQRRPFRRMPRIKIPTSFGGNDKPRGRFQTPFHEELFGELDNKINEYRKKRERQENIEALQQIPVGDGRDHIAAAYDSYYDPGFDAQSDGDEDDGFAPPDIPEDEDMHQQYAEICKKYIKDMVEDGKKGTRLSDTLKAFNEWETKLTPVLEAEKKRKGFDITETRKWIVLMAAEKGGAINFSNLTSSLLPHEISRVFLSSLFLSNSGDISISNYNPDMSSDFTITLLRDKDEIITSLEHDDSKDDESDDKK